MKKGLKVTIVIFASLILLILAIGAIVPVVFKEKIKEKVVTEINGTLNARVTFADYRLSLFRAFPDLSFSLKDLSVTGIDEFEGDTLAYVKSFGFVFNLMSLIGDKGYEIKSIEINKPLVNAIVMDQGAANWDIVRETEEIENITDTTDTSSEMTMNLRLHKFAINNGRIQYTDNSSGISASVGDLNFKLSGVMSTSQTGLDLDLSGSEVNVVMDRIPYLTDASVSFAAGIDARLDSMTFVLRDNSLKINDIILNLSGTAGMSGDNIGLDLTFGAPETSFKSLLSLVPAFYMKDFEGLRADGTFSLDGSVKGVYNSADSILPDISANLTVANGVISYPDLPEKITAIAVQAAVQTDGRQMDNSIVDISRFHFELAGNPFDIKFKLETPVSDPSVTASAKGKIDLAKLQQAVPVDSLSMGGLIDLSLQIAGRMSMLEEKQFDQFTADGSLNLSDMEVEMAGLPGIKISSASLRFTPGYAALNEMNVFMGGSDFTLSGRLENYLPYLLSDGILKGNLSLRSKVTDLNEIMGTLPSDTTEVDTVTTTEIVKIPADIDFSFDAAINRLYYSKLTADDVTGKVEIYNSTVKITETGMKAMGGSMLVNATYDTRDTLNPFISADMLINSVSIKEAFNTFNTVQKLMPAASGLGGNVTVNVDFKGLLGKDMMPVINTISGTGQLSSEAIQILESETFNMAKNVLKMNQSYTNVLKDVKVTFIINDGRLYIKPFNTRLGNIKVNISGDQGLDQTVNYLLKTEIPKEDLGEGAAALMGTLASQAAALGLNVAVPDVIKVNLKVTGSVKHPVITPVFAGSEGKSAAATVTEAVKEEVTEKVNDALSKQADKLISEAEEKAELLRQEAAATAETIREEAANQGKKLVKEAEKKGPVAVLAAKKAAETLVKEGEKRAVQLETEAGKKADQIIEEAKVEADELLK